MAIIRCMDESEECDSQTLLSDDNSIHSLEGKEHTRSLGGQVMGVSLAIFSTCHRVAGEGGEQGGVE